MLLQQRLFQRCKQKSIHYNIWNIWRMKYVLVVWIENGMNYRIYFKIDPLCSKRTAKEKS